MEPKDLLEGLNQTTRYGVLVDPLVVHAFSPGSFEAVYSAAQERAELLYRQYASVQRFSGFSDIPYSLSVTRWCLLQTLLSTSVFLHHEQTGQVAPTEGALSLAERNIRSLIENEGVEVLYATYYGIVGHDLLQPFVYYKELTLADYYSARRHYPYPGETLDVFLLIALYRHVLRIRFVNQQRVVIISRSGSRTYQWMHECLVEMGHVQRRNQLSHLYQFDSVKSWDDLSSYVWPRLNEVRAAYLDWLSLAGDGTLLEVGCGTGALTLDAGLYGHGGDMAVTATDVSSEMIAQAKTKSQRYGNPQNLQFDIASVENLPYQDNVFGACCGSFFLRFVNPTKALSEMRRVIVPGGTVSVLQAIRPAGMAPFFRDWFEPVLGLMEAHPDFNRTYLSTADDVLAWFQEVGFSELQTQQESTLWVFDHPEIVVQHMLHDLSFFHRPLVEVPWDDRNTIISELIDRGRDVCRKYPLAERTIEMQVIMVRGKK